MKFNNVYKHQIFILMFCILLLSCNKEEKISTSNEALVQVSLIGVDTEEDIFIPNSSQNSASLRNSTAQIEDNSIQTVVTAIDDKYEVIATLKPESSSSSINNLKAAYGNKAVIIKEVTPLQNNVKYRVIVFETATGAYVNQAQYSARNEASNVLALDAGRNYTFISYSYGTEANIPVFSTTANLNTFSIENIDGNANFMISKSNLLLKYGTNNLDIKIKHQLSQITTKISSFVTKGGVKQNITSASVFLLPHYNNFAIKLSDLTRSYTNPVANGKVLSFTSFGTSAITATSTILCGPETNTANLKISSMVIGGVTKTDVTLPEFNIKPGVKYNLDLEVRTTDDGYVTGNRMWAYANVIQTPIGGGPSSNFSFAKSPELRGSYFVSNTYNAVGKVTSTTPLPTGITSVDPCTQVVPADGANFEMWRTPDESDLKLLLNDKHVSGQYNGVWGMYFGTDVVPSISNRDKYLFLPIHGYLYFDEANIFKPSGGSETNTTEGSYWSFGSSDLIPRLFFKQNNNLVTVAGQPRRQAHQIRCVRNYDGL